jgi:hypothetical protein
MLSLLRAVAAVVVCKTTLRAAVVAAVAVEF